MKDQVLKERVKELIGDRRVTAALFYTFNFEAEFFENYVLPLFLPDIPFGDNKIQNSILWRKYQGELPPVCVYCDFHAKKPEAPSLDYAIRPIDLPTSNHRKPCFHPKHTYILLDDDSLITLLGSNNLTNAGWCSNLESVVEVIFKNGAFFPRTFKDQFRDLFFDLKKLDPDPDRNLTKAEEEVRRFLYKTKYTDEVSNRLYNSRRQDFYDFLREAKNDFNEGRPFQAVEIFSPYYAPSTNHINNLTAILEVNQLHLSIPFENTRVVGMEENLFEAYQNTGVVWSRIKAQEKEKAYRFNHSKVYRLLGDEKLITIIGSVNCTEAGSLGKKGGGNVETALLLVSNAEEWKPALERDYTEGYSFSGNKSEEGVSSERKEIPAIEFTLNWTEKQIDYRWLGKQGTGQIRLGETKHTTNEQQGTVMLRSAELLQHLADNAVIPFYYNRTLFYFFPVQIGIEARPLSTKLRLSDRQLLQLWANFDEAQIQSDNLEKIIAHLTREADGELLEISLEEGQSTMNLMAAHLNALIKLEQNLYRTGKTKVEGQRILKQRDYYLYTDNVDTLTGYYQLIRELNSKGIITNGFFWLLLEIIKVNFYEKAMIKEEDSFYSRHKDLVSRFSNQQVKLKRKMESEGVTRASLKWIKKMLAS